MASEVDYEEVAIIHPETGGQAVVPAEALGLYYAGGWVKLTAENAPAEPGPPSEPEPQSATQVSAGLAAKSEGGDQGDNAAPAKSRSSAKAGGAKNTEE